ncbi:MAG: glycosyltransferase family 39 protein [Terriglobales bacterium]|jgi:4-amino-4-deoxy-L-arabinose transferase-like glycosyltransferase
MSLPTKAPATGAAPTNVQGENARAARLPWAVLSGFAVRVAVMLATRAYLFPPVAPITEPEKQGWYFGYEIGRVARSIAEGRGFGSPFHGNTGPTAWLAPLYPYMVAGVFRVFGIYTQTSGIALLTLNSLFAALTAIPIYFIAERVLGARIARWSAWMWALAPVFYWTAVRWAWETSLSTLLLMLVLLLTLRLEDLDWPAWFAWGLLWGAIALTNPSLLSMAPFALAWTCARGWNRRRACVGNAILAVAVALVTITPWLVRNRQTFGQWTFVRDNFGAELRFGNGEQARGIWMGWTDPPLNDSELARYRRMGELPYIAAKQKEAIAFIRTRPEFFLNLSVRRFLLFWCGVPKDYSEDITPRDVLPQWPDVALATLAFIGFAGLLRRRKVEACFFAPALLVYPVVYYITFPDARYRHPIEPLMLMLAVYTVGLSLQTRAQASQK